MNTTSRPDPTGRAGIEWVAGWEQTPLLETLRRLLREVPLHRNRLARTLEMGQNDTAALEHLVDSPLGPVELARRLGVTTAAASMTLGRLEAAGHVVRRPDPHDGRRVLAHVTAAGRGHVLPTLIPFFLAIQAAIDELTQDEQAAVTRFLQAVLVAVQSSGR
jgi:DNA-binding MarR family transcriptional regulator